MPRADERAHGSAFPATRGATAQRLAQLRRAQAAGPCEVHLDEAHDWLPSLARQWSSGTLSAPSRSPV